MKFSFDTWTFVETEKHPHQLAFACSNGEVSWAALAQTTNDYLDIFAEKKLPAGRPVIIYGHKQKEFPLLMIACLRAGIPYIPVDEVMPPERVLEIVAQTQPSAVFNLTGRALNLPAPTSILGNINWIELQQTQPGYIDTEAAYLIFTSGSTGVPKGVIISRKALRNFSNWMKEDYPVTEKTVFINQVPFSFDVSLVELVGTLVFGAAAIFNTAEVAKNTRAFIERVNQYKGNFWNSTPSFALLCSTSPSFSETVLPQVTTFLFSGEELTSRVAQRVQKSFPHSHIYNAYGPTEATFTVTLGEMSPAIVNEYAASLPIGYPKKDSGVRIFLDGKILSTDSEEEGEIILSGENVATGYLHNPELTAEKFRTIDVERYYFTGDFGYYKNGMVFYKGRKDEQVKLNGFRIELGEINHLLGKVNGVEETITLPLKTGNQVRRIISFVKPITGHPAETVKQNCHQVATQKLPVYMVPSEILAVEDFPYNNNHKIDKNKLLDMYAQGLFNP